MKGQTSMTDNVPFLLRPSSKDYLWGGSRLNDDFNLGLDSDPLAEAWVCSTHPDGPSYTTSGKELTDILNAHPEYLGTHALSLTDGKGELPILIKFIDAKSDLSVQVHPDDEYARVNENGSRGKTEVWYVLDAKKDSSIIYGFSMDVDKETVRRSLEANKITRLLSKVPVHKNDVFMITPGTVHAIGSGCLIAEIQESSNVTYRFYDYDRTDKNGNKRELHIDKALEVADLKSTAAPRQPMRVIKYRSGYATELLSRCKYFIVERMLLNTENRILAEYKTDSNSFHSLLITDGCGSIGWEGCTSGTLNFFKGDCIFIPADSVPLTLHGRAQILDVSC